MFRITRENVNAQKRLLESLQKNVARGKEIDKEREVIRKEREAGNKRFFYMQKVGDKIDKYGKTPDLLKEFRFFYNMTDEEIMAYNPPKEQPKKLKIGVKKINETETAIKNQEKNIKSKKKQILNEQEYFNSMDKIMTGESNFIDNQGKWAVATELDVKKGLNPKIRRALKKSIIEQANKIKGTNIIMDF